AGERAEIRLSCRAAARTVEARGCDRQSSGVAFSPEQKHYVLMATDPKRRCAMCFEFEYLYWAKLEEEARQRKQKEEARKRVEPASPQPAKQPEQPQPVPV